MILGFIAELGVPCCIRAGGNGTAGTAMAEPVFEGEKWRRLDSNITCVIECPLRALRRSLGHLFKSSSIQSSDERIEASQFSMAIT